MACFTDKPYADWSYSFLVTISGLNAPVSLGCYSEMNDAQKRYQFYKALALRAGLEGFLSASCFNALTEDAQYNLLNEVLGLVVNPPIL